jgi:methionyl aminopeptidase
LEYLNQIQIREMLAGGTIAGGVLDKLIETVKPGITTLALDGLAEDWIGVRGGESAFKKVPGYKYTLCTPVNNEVVHAIPNERRLEKGDVLTIDLGVYYKGLFTDTAWTIVVGEKVGGEVKKFLDAGKKALWSGIDQSQAGKHVGDVSAAVEKALRKNGYGIPDPLTGHGVGSTLHQDPMIPNEGMKKGVGVKLELGMAFTIEPIYTDGSAEVFLEEDEWTIVAPYSKKAAVFEHSIVITKSGPVILTPNGQR